MDFSPEKTAAPARPIDDDAASEAVLMQLVEQEKILSEGLRLMEMLQAEEEELHKLIAQMQLDTAGPEAEVGIFSTYIRAEMRGAPYS